MALQKLTTTKVIMVSHCSLVKADILTWSLPSSSPAGAARKDAIKTGDMD